DEATTGGKVIIAGFGIGFVYYALEQILKTWKEIPTKVFGRPFEGGSVSLENNPALLGVGYIIGPRISSIMVGGGVLSYLVLIPAIKYFGAGLATPLAPETAHTIADMTVSQIQKGYILYIGAGAVAAGGIISLFRSLPIIWHGLKGGISDLRGTRSAVEDAPRVDQDLSMKWVLGGIIALLIVIMIAPQLNLRFNLLGAVLIIAFGFLFVTVSSRLTGELGSALILGPILMQLNKSGTVYAPRITFTSTEKLVGAENVVLTLDPSAPALQPFTGDFKPPQGGNYRVLQLEKSDRAAVESLKPGEYLVDGSGLVTPRSGEGAGAPVGSLKPGDYLVDDGGHIAYRTETDWPA